MKFEDFITKTRDVMLGHGTVHPIAIGVAYKPDDPVDTMVVVGGMFSSESEKKDFVRTARMIFSLYDVRRVFFAVEMWMLRVMVGAENPMADLAKALEGKTDISADPERIEGLGCWEVTRNGAQTAAMEITRENGRVVSLSKPKIMGARDGLFMRLLPTEQEIKLALSNPALVREMIGRSAVQVSDSVTRGSVTVH